MSHYSSTLVFVLLVSSVAISEANTDQQQQQTFIVTLQNDLKPSPFTNLLQWYTSALATLGSGSENTSKTEFIHVYNTVINGFAARFTIKQSEQLNKFPGVLSVSPDTIFQLHTTRSTQFLGLDPTQSLIMTESDHGSDIIIGVFDSGIWPERRSFHDKGLGPIPPRWKGECTEGENFTKSHCNRKIIGARYFLAGYNAGGSDARSARDSDGHGTHTASIAAGRAIPNASFFGYAQGVATGVAPKARIAVYRICWEFGCRASDILAAFDKAIEDGVDVISLSVGGAVRSSYNLDPIAIGSFAAMRRGIFVSASAGNSGPDARTSSNGAPWITTVGASTIDRKFPADLVLGDGRTITGVSVYSGINPFVKGRYWPLIYGGNAAFQNWSAAASFCTMASLDKKLVRGKVVMCNRGGGSRFEKGQVVKDAGGVGVIIANMPSNGDELATDPHLIAALSITDSSRKFVEQYLQSTSNPKARMVFHATQVGVKVKPVPIVASFSSRGPSGESIYVLKPDLIAPGVDILGACPAAVSPSGMPTDTRRTEFVMRSGTSMSCPHVSGVAALLKGVHRHWSPAMIRSALMTTAYMHDRDGNPILVENSNKRSTIWDTGAGHVDPNKAVDPGLVYDLMAQNYLDFLCASNYSRPEIKKLTGRSTACKGKENKPWDLNYPAISVSFKPLSSGSEVLVKRTLTCVSEGSSTYTVSVRRPKGTILKVKPSKLFFKGKGDKQTYVVQILNRRAKTLPSDNLVTEVGKITWINGKHNVVSPIIVSWMEPSS